MSPWNLEQEPGGREPGTWLEKVSGKGREKHLGLMCTGTGSGRLSEDKVSGKERTSDYPWVFSLSRQSREMERIRCCVHDSGRNKEGSFTTLEV